MDTTTADGQSQFIREWESQNPRVFKQPRMDIVRPLRQGPWVVTMGEAIEDCLRFSCIKDRDEIRRTLLRGDRIYTNFSVFSVKE